jgi:membrane associated rhomboid family serine protease
MPTNKIYRRKFLRGFSHRLLIITGIIYLLDFLMFNKLTHLFGLEPQLVASKMEFWRIFTFPFTPSSIEGLFLFIFTFFFIGPKLELKLRKNFYPIILFFLICLQGTLITLIFWQSNLQFNGMEGLSFFILVLFTLINLNKKITLWGLRPIKSIMLVTLLSITWISSTAVHSIIAGNDILIKALSNLIFGILTSGVTYLQIEFFNLQKKLDKEKKINDIESFGKSLTGDITPAFVEKKENKASNFTLNDNSFLSQNNEFIFSEQKLNDILDKINEKGKNSLTEEEINYLKEYSNNL